jgi:pSer/pThr/pTyr-binding forkhead associated (FHA) protein
MIVRVRIVAPKSKRGSFTVRLPLLVGRGAEAKFRIQHDQVSRRHCEFFAGDAAVYVRDLGSTNGTFIAGEQIPTSVRTPVPCGAMVRVGKVAFVVEYSQAAVTASAGDHKDDTQAGFDLGGDRSAASGEESFAVDHPDDLPLPDGADGVEPADDDPAAESGGDDPFAAVAAAFRPGGDAAAELPPEDSAPGQEPTAAEQAGEQAGVEQVGVEPSAEPPAEEAAAAAEGDAPPPKTDPEPDEPGSAAKPDDEFLDFLKGLP